MSTLLRRYHFAKHTLYSEIRLLSFHKHFVFTEYLFCVFFYQWQERERERE